MFRKFRAFLRPASSYSSPSGFLVNPCIFHSKYFVHSEKSTVFVTEFFTFF